jgi:hypothetical protein
MVSLALIENILLYWPYERKGNIKDVEGKWGTWIAEKPKRFVSKRFVLK